MRKIYHLLLAITGLVISYNATAQTGLVYTIGGGGASTASGVPATLSFLSYPTGIWMSNDGSIYFTDSRNNSVDKINQESGIIYKIGGGGSSLGDGGPATGASLSYPIGICGDAVNNLYIADKWNNRIRKITMSTGVITTVAGGGLSTADGVPATTASLGPILAICVDASGNIYTGDTSNKIRRIDATSGIITTVAGIGTSTNTGDGGPATNAGIAGPVRYMSIDAAGNMFIIPATKERIRKIDAGTGIITTIAGGGSWTADGVAATSALLAAAAFSIDNSGNIFVADTGHGAIRVVSSTTGLINTIAGHPGSTGLCGNGVPAVCANIFCGGICLDTMDNVYFSDGSDSFRAFSCGAGYVRKIIYSSPDYAHYHTGSFDVGINKLCEGPEITITVNSIAGLLSVKTFFGDGESSTVPISASCTAYATFNHIYPCAGTYTLKFVLLGSGGIAIDSVYGTYRQINCTTIPVNFYYDENSNCIKDSSEHFIFQPTLTEIDSNGIAVDTISSTSGFYYSAYGVPGTIYNFKPLSLPAGLEISCPLSGIIADTISPFSYNNAEINFALSCSGTSGFDLAVYAVVPNSSQDEQFGYIYPQNSFCGSSLASTATVTLKHSSKYISNIGSIEPPPASYTDSTITWNVVGLLATSVSFGNVLFYKMSNNPAIGILVPHDTVHSYFSITPVVGDEYPANNNLLIVDTVRVGFDPNEMWVSPSGCISDGTKKLQYTISFENTGNDTAFNIHVMDTLSDNVDPKSMRIVMASAQMNTTLFNSGGYNILKFDFPAINLLDSSHHGQCDGAVIYTINVKDGLPAAATVFNNAGIYFDTNPAVMTNTVENIIGGCDEVVPVISNKDKIDIYPNPTSETLTIKTAQDAYNTYTITNSMGQVLLQNELNSTVTNVNVKTLAPGLYCITLRGESGTIVQKFVKM